MLANVPIDPDHTFRFMSLQAVGAHEHVQRTDRGGLGKAVGLLGAAALLVAGYVLGGVATSGNDAAPGVVRVTIPAPAQGALPLGPGNQQPVGVAAR